MIEPHPRIWVMLGHRRGDNNQALALAEALGLPFETRSLRYNMLRRLDPRLVGESLASLEPESRRQLEPPWPDLVIGIGRRSVPVSRYIRRVSGGRAKLVRIGNPRVSPRLFDLVITTAQYPVDPGENVVRLPLVMSRYRSVSAPEPDEQEFLSSLPRPHLLLAVGGRTMYWRMAPEAIGRTASLLQRRAGERGGSLIVVTSQRTEPRVLDALRAAVEGQSDCRMVTGSRPRFPVLLNQVDELFVTADSLSMISEAILTGKPVGIVPIEFSPLGRVALNSGPLASGRRDIRKFWKGLEEGGLTGTIDAPISARVEDPVVTAANAVRALLVR